MRRFKNKTIYKVYNIPPGFALIEDNTFIKDSREEQIKNNTYITIIYSTYPGFLTPNKSIYIYIYTISLYLDYITTLVFIENYYPLT